MADDELVPVHSRRVSVLRRRAKALAQLIMLDDAEIGRDIAACLIQAVLMGHAVRRAMYKGNEECVSSLPPVSDLLVPKPSKLPSRQGLQELEAQVLEAAREKRMAFEAKQRKRYRKQELRARGVAMPEREAEIPFDKDDNAASAQYGEPDASPPPAAQPSRSHQDAAKERGIDALLGMQRELEVGIISKRYEVAREHREHRMMAVEDERANAVRTEALKREVARLRRKAVAVRVSNEQ